jgi:hypothetical protein
VGVFEPIPASYWLQHEVDFNCLIGGYRDIVHSTHVTDKGTMAKTERYKSLMMNRAQVERLWPIPQS